MTIWSRGTSQSEHQDYDMKEINSVVSFLSQCYFIVSLSQQPSLSLRQILLSSAAITNQSPKDKTAQHPGILVSQLGWLIYPLSLGGGAEFYVWEVGRSVISGRPEGWTVAENTICYQTLFFPFSTV